MRGSAEHTVKKPDNTLKGFASTLKSAQDSSEGNYSEGNGSERIANGRLSDAIDDL
jgi:hypothetical protein